MRTRLCSLALLSGLLMLPVTASAEPPPGADAAPQARPGSIKEYDDALREQRGLILAAPGVEQRLAERKRLRELLSQYGEDVHLRSPALIVSGTALLLLGGLATVVGVGLLTTGGSSQSGFGASWDLRGAAPLFLVPGTATAAGGITMIVFGATRVMKSPEKTVYRFGCSEAPASAVAQSAPALSLQFGPGGVQGAF